MQVLDKVVLDLISLFLGSVGLAGVFGTISDKRTLETRLGFNPVKSKLVIVNHYINTGYSLVAFLGVALQVFSIVYSGKLFPDRAHATYVYGWIIVVGLLIASGVWRLVPLIARRLARPLWWADALDLAERRLKSVEHACERRDANQPELYKTNYKSYRHGLIESADLLEHPIEDCEDLSELAARLRKVLQSIG